jgi:hypothetical protein
MLELENVIDRRIGSAALVIRIGIDFVVLRPWVRDESKEALLALAEFKLVARPE